MLLHMLYILQSPCILEVGVAIVFLFKKISAQLSQSSWAGKFSSFGAIRMQRMWLQPQLAQFIFVGSPICPNMTNCICEAETVTICDEIYVYSN